MLYDPSLHIVLFEPEIPQNAGNIARTCVALQAKLWFVHPLGFQLSEKQVRRAGLDYWQHLEWEDVADWNELTNQLAGHRFWFFSKRAKKVFWDTSFRTGDVFVFGAETTGLPDWMLEQHKEQCLTIPMPGPVRSLNLGNAAAVVMYEAYRGFAHDA